MVAKLLADLFRFLPYVWFGCFLYIPIPEKKLGSSVIFLWNFVLILNEKENKEAIAICLEIRIPYKKKKELSWKVPSNIHRSNFIMEKNNKKIWFVNISEHQIQEMGLVSTSFFLDCNSFVMVTWHYFISSHIKICLDLLTLG